MTEGTFWSGVQAPPTNANQAELERYASTNSQRLLGMLWDCEWHTSKQCIAAAGHRFGASLHLLRDSGWNIETVRIDESDAFRPPAYVYRLIDHERGNPRRSKVRLYIPHGDVVALLDGRITDELLRIAAEALDI